MHYVIDETLWQLNVIYFPRYNGQAKSQSYNNLLTSQVNPDQSREISGGT